MEEERGMEGRWCMSKDRVYVESVGRAMGGWLMGGQEPGTGWKSGSADLLSCVCGNEI